MLLDIFITHVIYIYIYIYINMSTGTLQRTLAEVKEARKTAIERQKVEEKLRGQEQTKVIAKLRRQLQALRHKVLSFLDMC